MRLPLVTPLVVALALAAALTACTGPGSGESPAGGPEESAEQIEQTARATVREAVPLAVTAIGGDRVRAEAAWTACMPGLSWKYDGAGVFKAPEGEVQAQLEEIRTVLLDAGFSDVTKVDDQVAVERDGVTLAVSPHLATGDPQAWQLSFQTECLTLSGDDKDHVEADTRAPVDGLD